VQRRPDLFSAYVATDLYVDMVRNEAVKHQLTLDRLRAAGNSRAIGALKRIGGDPTRWDLRAWNTNMALAFKTNTPTPNLDRGLLLPLAFGSPLYSLRDLYHVFIGFRDATRLMFDQIVAYDARRLGTRFEVPFLVVQGDSDVITLTSLAGEYVAEVEAPAKKMALISNAGHFAAFTHPDTFLAELLAFTPTVRADALTEPRCAPDARRSSPRGATTSEPIA
jgi:pimeloyl-ACP methyl ester carboxylesterase